jgi:FkbM family methyltransferase
LGSGVVNRICRYVTPRNVERYFGARAMEVAVEAYWRRLRQRRDLAALVTDYFVTPGSAVADIGASWGLFTHHMGRRVGSSGSVDCFEPHPLNLPALRAAVENGRPVRVHALALSDSKGSATLHVPRAHGRSVTAQARLAHEFANVDFDTIEIDVDLLDNVMEPAELLDFVKIDVEGHELAVLRGGEHALRHAPPMLIEIEQRHLNCDIHTAFEQIQNLGYEMWMLKNDTLRPIGEFALDRDQGSHVTSDFEAFSLPRGYVSNFLAVKSGTPLDGLPTSAS